MLTVTLQPLATMDGLAERWMDLEARAACSFFQSWAWVGCLAQERFDDPVLIEARRHGEVMALGLFNRRRRAWPGLDRLFLGETGRPAWDGVFIEHNGFLIAQGEGDALRRCLATALRGHAVVLSGVGAAELQATQGAACLLRQTRLAPCVHLSTLTEAGGRYLDRLSANTRHQLRRSARRYAEAGPLEIVRADGPGQAHEFLDALALLHQAAWTARGRAGAFADPAFARFHHALIERTRAVEVLRISAGRHVIGYLHNFCFRGRVSAYQSGFAYAAAPAQAKPGMTCHHLAIEQYLTQGMSVYDFMAGDDRYKTSLATGSAPLHWLTLAPKRSWLGVAAWLKHRLQALAGAAR